MSQIARPTKARLAEIRRNLANGLYSDEEVISELLAEISAMREKPRGADPIPTTSGGR